MTRRSSTRIHALTSSTRKRTSTQAVALTTPKRVSKRLKSDTIVSTNTKTTKTHSGLKGERRNELQDSSSDDELDHEQDESAYENEKTSLASSASNVDENDQDDIYGEVNLKSRQRKTQRGKTIESQTGKDKPGAITSSGTGPGSKKQVIVRIPKPRTAGDTPYEDHTIHPNTFLFLKDLAQNNRRDWLKMHDVDFRTSEKDFDSFAEALTEKIIEHDETIPELPIKDIKFRIYRDIRFTPDPTPYKPYFAAAWSRTGRKGPYAAYYVQIQPGNSFIGGGLWHPDAGPLALLRRAVDRKPHKLKQVLTEPGLGKEFFGGIPKDERKAVKAFVRHNEENMLKTKPKDFPGDHPDIELLRLRNYTIGKRLTDDEVLGPKGLERITGLLGCLTPFVSYLNSVVMPDEPSSGEDASNDDNDDDDDDDNDADNVEHDDADKAGEVDEDS